jgi:hypothetical protein
MSAPASAKAKAMAWPMPRVPPVTRAVLPLREKRDITSAIVRYLSIVQIARIVEKKRRRDEETKKTT